MGTAQDWCPGGCRCKSRSSQFHCVVSVNSWGLGFEWRCPAIKEKTYVPVCLCYLNFFLGRLPSISTSAAKFLSLSNLKLLRRCFLNPVCKVCCWSLSRCAVATTSVRCGTITSSLRFSVGVIMSLILLWVFLALFQLGAAATWFCTARCSVFNLFAYRVL